MSQSPPVVVSFSESLGSSLLSRSMGSDYQHYRKKRDIMGMLANVRNYRDMEDLYYHFNLSQDLLCELARNKVGIEHVYKVYLKHGWYWTLNYIVNLPLDEVGDKLISYGFMEDIINDLRDGKRDKDQGLDYVYRSKFYEIGYRYDEFHAYLGCLELLLSHYDISNVIIGAYDLYAVTKALRSIIELEDVKLWLSNLMPSSNMYVKLSNMLRDYETSIELQVDEQGYPKLYQYRGYGMKDSVVVRFENDEIIHADIPKSYIRNFVIKRDKEGFYYYNNYKFVHSIKRSDELQLVTIYELTDDRYNIDYNATTKEISFDEDIQYNEAAKGDNLLTRAGLKHDIGYYLLRELIRVNSPSKYRITDDIFIGEATKPDDQSVIYDTAEGRIFATYNDRVNLDEIQDVEKAQLMAFDQYLPKIALGAYSNAISLKCMFMDRYFYVNGMKYPVPDITTTITVLVEDAVVNISLYNDNGDITVENAEFANPEQRNFATGTYQSLLFDELLDDIISM